MCQLSRSQANELDDLWTQLGIAYPLTSPPETDDQVLATALDSWIAGVLSSTGQFTQKALDDLVDVICELDASESAQSFADRVLALARSAVDAGE